MKRVLSNVISGVTSAWCHAMHPDPMWPINGTYRCPKCLRVYPVRWANGLPPHEGHNHTRSRIAA